MKSAEINFILGDVFAKREGKIIFLRKGDHVNEGDIFRVPEKSIVEFSLTDKGKKLRVTGPKIFRFKMKVLESSIKRGVVVTGFSKLLSKNSPPYVPRTIVSAVRGKDDFKRREEINKTGKRKLNEAAKLMAGRKFIETWGMLNEIGNMKGLNRHIKAIISFYRGEIHFEEMEYEKALAYYIEAAEYRSSKFKHREESYVRAIICADLAGKNLLLDDLIGKYRKDYGDKSRYDDILKEYRK